MIRTITAVERDGFDLRLLTVVFEIPSRFDFNLMEALQNAVTDYCKTKEGREIYEYNCSCFNLADIDTSLPKDWLEKYGVKYINSYQSDEVDWDESFCVEDLDD